MRRIANIIEDREVLFVGADQTVREVVDYMCEHRIGAVPIKKGNEVVGVFSERDLLRRVVHRGLDTETVPIREVMSEGYQSVSPDEDYRVAKMHMYEFGIRHLVVMDENDELRGLVSMRDIVKLDIQEYSDLVTKLNDRYYQTALKNRKKK